MAFDSMSKADFARLTGLDGNSKYRRELNPDLWKPTEIYAFAIQVGLWDGGAKRLDSLADLIEHLPEFERKIILKAGLLTKDKLQIRRQDSNSWLPQELEKLAAWHRQNAIHVSRTFATGSAKTTKRQL
ncbi:hypothetical protein [Fibrella forsythiae]|uniref:Uncharacterized protein n=1 Tax=Fibrella forsythiae TaxID=2817061 RepID=A0ABS3JPF8_9BACT|nr:hypothetical protein [Fibrella forsythiae]MBO0950807.1 hypothetical protein [Fibrella forsythiae]